MRKVQRHPVTWSTFHGDDEGRVRTESSWVGSGTWIMLSHCAELPVLDTYQGFYLIQSLCSLPLVAIPVRKKTGSEEGEDLQRETIIEGL